VLLVQLQVYSQCLDQNVVGEAALNINTLRQDVTIAVETQVHNNLRKRESPSIVCMGFIEAVHQL